MNSIHRYKQYRQRAKREHERNEILAKIPQSQLAGIKALPTELWGQIVDHVLDPHLQGERSSCTLADILRLRLLCREHSQLSLLAIQADSKGSFDQEVTSALQRRLTLNNLPQYPFLSIKYERDTRQQYDQTYRDAILASALYRAVCGKGGRSSRHLMVHRVRNCALIARCIDGKTDDDYRDVLLRKLCTTASTSRCCWQYIFALRCGKWRNVPHVDDMVIRLIEGDLALEAALLMANDYNLEEVKRWLIKLGKKGLVTGYRVRDGKVCAKCGKEHWWAENGNGYGEGQALTPWQVSVAISTSTQDSTYADEELEQDLEDLRREEGVGDEQWFGVLDVGTEGRN